MDDTASFGATVRTFSEKNTKLLHELAPKLIHAIAEGFGAKGFAAATEADYIAALDAAFAHNGPSLIDVMVNPAGYAAQLQAMRG